MTYRVAIIGCGAIAGTHLKALQAAKQTVCALCDIEPQKAAAFAEKRGISAAIYRDYLQMLDEARPDAVHICTPHYLHADMCVEALRRGIHVLCEKPLGISEEQLEQVMEAEKKSTATLGVCLQNRYAPAFLRLKELAKDGVLGAMGIVCWNRDAAYYASGEWRGKWATEGGGVMINQALHTLDLLQWICGMPTRVTAHISNDHLGGVIEVEDTATALFETADGTQLNFFATTAGGSSFPAQLQVITKDKKTLYADSSLLSENGNPVSLSDSATIVGKQEWGSGHRALIADFYRCLSEGFAFPVTAEEGGKSVRLILSMYRSNGQKIDV